MPIKVGDRNDGNPNTLHATFDRPSTSNSCRARVRLPNFLEGQGHFEKFKIREAADLVSVLLNSAKDLMSVVPKIKCFESVPP